jgi:hypothetical protein
MGSSHCKVIARFRTSAEVTIQDDERGLAMQFFVGFIAMMVLIVACSVSIEHSDALVEQMLRRSKFVARDWWVGVTAFCVSVVALIVALQPGIRDGWGGIAGFVCGLIAAFALRTRFGPARR